jgi:2'-5' RNA ligase
MTFRPKHYRHSYSSRSYPRFAPHITLATFALSSATLPPLNALIPANAHPVPVFFESVNIGNTYLGAFSVRVAKSPELMSLHDGVLNGIAANGIEARSRSFPHMSLFYVDEEEARQQLTDELFKTERVTTVSQGGTTSVLLRPDPRATGLLPLEGFNGTQVWLVDCNSKNVEAWEVKEKISLRTTRREASSAHHRRQSSSGHQGRDTAYVQITAGKPLRAKDKTGRKHRPQDEISEQQLAQHVHRREYEHQRRRKRYDEDKVSRGCGWCSWFW